MDWTAAACAGKAEELFFVERGASTREARNICRSCPIRDACGEYAITNRINHGIWGGLSERERRAIRRHRGRGAA